MQLVAYGAQDVYLTGNPQITFFKVVYRRHTNFSMESIEQTFNGNADFGKKVTCTISRNGDLIYRTYLQVTIPAVTLVDSTKQFRWVNWLGHQLINNVVLEIGGQQIDKHYGQWLHIWNELSQTAGHKDGYANMVGNVPQLTQYNDTIPSTTLYIPLEFWFNRNPGLALPLIALQYHEVKINLEFNPASSMYQTNATGFTLPSLGAASLFIDYIYLDTDERRRFAQVSHEYLIEQLQYTVLSLPPTPTTRSSSTSTILAKSLYGPFSPLPMLLPVSSVDLSGSTIPMLLMLPMALVFLRILTVVAWVSWLLTVLLFLFSILLEMPLVLSVLPLDLSRSWILEANCTSKAKLQLNGHDRFVERDGRYFNLVQALPAPHQRPCYWYQRLFICIEARRKHQPSGTCNFSRIDNATLLLTLTPNTIGAGSALINVYATNYNVLRIMSGMGGLAYSN
jgi:hypothetical protein